MKKQCTLFVAGMHCQSCELIIEKRLKKTDIVLHAHASLSEKVVHVTYDHRQSLDLALLNDALADVGYTLHEEPVGTVHWDTDTILKAIIILAIAFAGYLYIQNTGLIGSLSLTSRSSLPAFFLFGIVAGLSSCAALVGGLLLSLSKQWNSLYGGNQSYKRFIPFSLFNIGRLASFVIFGGTLGLIGSFFQLSITSTAFLVIAVSILMVVIGLQMLHIPWFSKIRIQVPRFISRHVSDEQNFQGKYMPFLAGVGTFFIPCGFTLLAQSIALTTGSFVTSALMMGMFALGTLPILAVLSFGSIKLQTNAAVAGTFNLVVGIAIVLFGVYSLNAQLNVLGLPSLQDAVKASAPEQNIDTSGLGVKLVQENGQTIQEVFMKAEGFAYAPQTLQLKADIPTRLTVTASNVTGCAQAMYLSGLYPDVVFLNKPVTQVTFTPKKGSYKISCAMGMVSPVQVLVD